MIRIVTCVIAMASASAAFAQEGALGTRASLVASPAQNSGSSGMPLMQMLIALLLVAGLLKFVLPKVMNKMNKRLNPTLGSSIRIEESAQLAGGTLYVVEVRGKSLLLSVSPTGVSCLSDLTAPPTSESKQEDTRAFFDILDSETQRDADALARLEQLAGSQA